MLSGVRPFPSSEDGSPLVGAEIIIQAGRWGHILKPCNASPIRQSPPTGMKPAFSVCLERTRFQHLAEVTER